MYEVLIVDDSPVDRNGLENHIPWDTLNCHITLATDGIEGLKLALSLKPDIVITDISMPGMNGIEMTKSIHEQLPDVYFIYMSYFDDFDFAVSGIKHGVSAYILKPISIPDMIDNIKKLCEKIDLKRKNVETLSKYKKQIEENHDTLTEKFLINLLLGLSKDASVESQAKFLGIDFDASYVMSVFLLEEDPEISDTQKAYISLFRLKNLIADQILYYHGGHCIIYDSSILILIIKSTSENTEQFLAELTNLQERFLRENQTAVTICFTNRIFPLKSLYHEFEKQLNILRQEHFTQSGSIIMSEEVNAERFELKSVIKNEIYSEISTLLLCDNNSKINDFVDKYFAHGNNMGEVDAKVLSFHIINAVNTLLIEQNESFEKVFGNEIKIWEKLIHYKSIVNISQWIKNILIITSKYLNTRTENNFLEIVNAIKKNIDQNYSTIQSLNQITDNLYLTSGYSSRIFKKYTNQTIFEYLLSRRIMEAKKLLENKNLKLNDIASKVGYQSNTYFTTAFKKHTGLTPTEYRNKL